MLNLQWNISIQLTRYLRANGKFRHFSFGSRAFFIPFRALHKWLNYFFEFIFLALQNVSKGYNELTKNIQVHNSCTRVPYTILRSFNSLPAGTVTKTNQKLSDQKSIFSHSARKHFAYHMGTNIRTLLFRLAKNFWTRSNYVVSDKLYGSETHSQVTRDANKGIKRQPTLQCQRYCLQSNICKVRFVRLSRLVRPKFFFNELLFNECIHSRLGSRTP